MFLFHTLPGHRHSTGWGQAGCAAPQGRLHKPNPQSIPRVYLNTFCVFPRNTLVGQPAPEPCMRAIPPPAPPHSLPALPLSSRLWDL